MADKKQSPKASSKPEKESTKSDKKKADQPASNGKKFLARVKQFFKDVRTESKKVVWNSKEDTIKNTGVVLMVVLVVGAGVWLSDWVLTLLRGLLYDLSAADAQTAVIMLQGVLADLF